MCEPRKHTHLILLFISLACIGLLSFALFLCLNYPKSDFCSSSVETPSVTEPPANENSCQDKCGWDYLDPFWLATVSWTRIRNGFNCILILAARDDNYMVAFVWLFSTVNMCLGPQLPHIIGMVTTLPWLASATPCAHNITTAVLTMTNFVQVLKIWI